MTNSPTEEPAVDGYPTRTTGSRSSRPRRILRQWRRWRSRSTRPLLPDPHHRSRRVIRSLFRSPLLRLVVAAILVVHVRSRYEDLLDRRAAWGETVRVPVMAGPRSVGSIVRADDLLWKDFPRSAVSPGTFTIASQITGRRLVAAIDAGEPVTSSRLSKTPISSLRARIGGGRFAVAISLREHRPRVTVGDEVDVIDASGAIAAARSAVVAADADTVTLSVDADEIRSLGIALGGPVVLAVRGEDSGRRIGKSGPAG